MRPRVHDGAGALDAILLMLNDAKICQLPNGHFRLLIAVTGEEISCIAKMGAAAASRAKAGETAR